MKIRVLPDKIVNKISAGEVVERPASVVRELVDNALDAGATEVFVYLENGGHSLIRVVDNGSGMDRDDAILAFERHATSKIQNENDLVNIHTFGFRGEALPSIAAVSKLRLKTRVTGREHAHEVIIEGGRLLGVNEASGPQGTDISVRQLFYNVPARRKFLKSEKTEELRVKAWLQQSSIANPSVQYRLYLNGKEVLNLPPRASSADRAIGIFKGATVPFARSFPFRMERSDESSETRIDVEGVIGHPSSAQSDSSAFVILVNGRLISDRMLLRAAKDGFDFTLKDREFPLGYIHLRLDPRLVDVNVHPQKGEVRFWDQRVLFGLVRDLVHQTVQSFKSPLESPSSVQWNARRTASSVYGPVYSTSKESGSVHQMEAFPFVKEPSAINDSEPEGFAFSELRYIGQLLECYLLCEWRDRFVVVDMHAAHERCNFNRIRNEAQQGRAASQALLLPMSVQLTEEGAWRLASCQCLMDQLGFEIEDCGDGAVIVRAAPALLDTGNIEQVVKEIAASELESEGEGRAKEAIDSIAARIACHASVRSGQQLEREEVYSLFGMLDLAEFSTACPHGRPVVVAFDRADVERWFGRDR